MGKHSVICNNNLDKTKTCEFSHCDERILEQIIQTTENTDLIRNIIRRKWSLEQTLTEMQIMKETEEQVRAMNTNSTADVARINRMRPNRDTNVKDHASKSTCKYCWKIYPWRKDLCPAYGKKCIKCGRFNHFASVCKSSTNKQGSRYHTDNIVPRMFQYNKQTNIPELEDDTFIGDSIRHLRN